MATTAPPQKLWVLLKSNDDSAVVNNPTQVPTKDCENVDDFIDAIKKKLSPKLDQVAVDNITLHLTKDGPALEPDDALPAQNTKQTALVVTAPPSAAPSSGSLMKAARQKTLKKVSLEASCRRFLDAIAVKLSTLYSFPWAHNGGPTIGDVLDAVFPPAQRDDEEEEDDGPMWSFLTEQKTHWRMNAEYFRTKINRGDALTTVPLPDVFTPDEWTELRKFNRKTTDRVHDGLLLSDGTPCNALPHADYSPEMVECLENIYSRLISRISSQNP